MKKFTVRITNDLLETRIYVSEASTEENAINECKMLYKFSGCVGNITKVVATPLN